MILSLGNSVPGKCSLTHDNSLLFVNDKTIIPSKTKDPFGFPILYAPDRLLHYRGLMMPSAGFTLLFQLFNHFVEDNETVLMLLNNGKLWLSFGLTLNGDIFIK